MINELRPVLLTGMRTSYNTFRKLLSLSKFGHPP